MSTFLATTGSGLARAEQTAGRWSVEHLLSGKQVACLTADPLQPGTVYAGSRGAGVLCSQDSGKSWHAAGLSGQTVKAIATSRLIPGLLYAGTKPACLFVSQDGGQHWQELPSFRKIFSRHFWFSPAEPPFSAYVQSIALSPTRPQVIIVGIEAGAVVRSTDGGATWQDHRPGALRDCHSLTFHVTNGEWVYEAGGTGAGAAFSSDGGITWEQPHVGLDRHYGWACAADPQQPDTWYVSASPSPIKAHSENNAHAAIFRSTRHGVWQKLSGGLPDPLACMPYALLTHPAEPGCVYAGLSNGDIWRSCNLGETWEQQPVNLKRVERYMITVE